MELDFLALGHAVRNEQTEAEANNKTPGPRGKRRGDLGGSRSEWLSTLAKN